MKKATLILLCSLLVAGCNNAKTINGITYETFGIADEDEKRNPNIEYKVSIGSVVVAAIFSETIVIPIYIVCYDLWEPSGPKTSIKGQLVRP